MAETYRDPSASVGDRVDDLLARMTLDEKLAQLGCLWITSLIDGDHFDPDAAAERMPHGIGQVTRIGASSGLRPQASATLMNAIQAVAVERTRLGIPLVVHEEAAAGLCARDATVFPQGIGLASTWDPSLIGEVADVIRRQMLAVGARHALAPVLDIARDPRWGRVEETYGEDPFLAGAIGTAYVRGLQTDDLRNGVVATAKHFLGYGLSEGGMNHAPVQLGPRELREVYAEPFAAAIRDAGLASVMNSYSSVDGLPCAGAPAILDGLLRDELGFDGVVVADYFSVVLLMSHHCTAVDKGDAAAQALTAGLDMELPATDCYGSPLAERIEQGRLDVDVVDRSVRRVLECKVRLGLFERPYVDPERSAAVYDTPADRSLARRVAARSIVLLHNDGVLPLDPGVATIAVVGPTADDRRLLQGDYHYPAHLEIIYEAAAAADPVGGDSSGGVDLLPRAGGAFAPGPYFTPHVTPLEGIRAAVADSARVVHQLGCRLVDRAYEDLDSDLVAAVDAAREAEVAVVCVGGKSGLQPHCTVGEFRDATDLDLTGAQSRLIGEVAATGTPTVVVLLGGRVFTVADVVDLTSALVQAWLPGEEGGHALADVLFGAVNPAGRLPVSMPRSVGQVPVYAGHRAGGGRSQVYGDYTDSSSAPLFAFGHGLSYTEFEHRHLRIDAGTTTEPSTASIEVANVGDRAGDEVVQLYGRDDVASVARPQRQLIGFARVTLEAGESRTVRFTIHPSRLAFYDQSMRFVVEPGTFTFSVGASSADLRAHRRVTLDGDVTEYQQRSIVPTAVVIE